MDLKFYITILGYDSDNGKSDNKRYLLLLFLGNCISAEQSNHPPTNTNAASENHSRLQSASLGHHLHRKMLFVLLNCTQ